MTAVQDSQDGKPRNLKPEHRELIMGGGAELARKGLQVDFSREAFTPGTELFKRVVD
jgi:hypothetical protein